MAGTATEPAAEAAPQVISARGAERRRAWKLRLIDIARSPPLFWRTFLLIILLIVAVLAAWLQSFRVFEREPRAAQVAAQVVSIVNTTRSALLHSDPVLRRELLADLADNEGIRVAPLEANDLVTPFPDVPLTRMIRARIIARLGAETRVAAEVNGVPGIWTSFDIAGDAYWVVIDRDLFSRDVGRTWIGWAVMAAILSLLVAVLITRAVNRPLAALSRAARDLGAGRVPPALPEYGPVEIRTVNASFNKMVDDLAKLAQDRAVLLAGISHDLRTPMARLRLELEMLNLSDEARQAMIGDIEQMDAIVAQFLDYARPVPQTPAEAFDLADILRAAIDASRLQQAADTTVDVRIVAPQPVRGHRTELLRALDNLLTNAHRYGRDPETGRLALSIDLERRERTVRLRIADHGPGIEAGAVERLLRPFERGDAARSGTRGAGLGLAIIDRIARAHGGRLTFGLNPPRGLAVELELPAQ